MATTQRAKVIQVLASGIILELEDGREGFLPRRAFTHLVTRDLRQAVPPDKEFQVVVEEGETAGPRVNVLLSSDELWEQLRQEHPHGSFMHGVVSGIESYGVFLDLIPGIKGLAPNAELSNEPLDPNKPDLLLGDIVQCQIQSINTAERHVRLSLRAASEERRRALERAEPPLPVSSSSPDKPTNPPRQTTEPREELAPPSRSPRPRPVSLSVLLVDDDAIMRTDIAERVTAWGHRLTQADSYAAGRAALEQKRFRIALLDIRLGDGSGLDLAEELLKQPSPPRVVLMTDASTALEKRERIELLQAQGVTQILKLDYANELETLFTHELETASSVHPPRNESVSNDSAHSSLDTKLGKILRDLRHHTGASDLVLFGLDETRQQIQILKKLGAQALDERELQLHWQFSPLRDVLEDGESVFSEDARAGKERARFQYLLRFLPFASVVGGQMPGEPRGALFMFHSNPRRFHREDSQFVRAAVERAAAAFEVEKALQALATSQSAILLGQLNATVIHEVSNKVGHVRSIASGLPGDLQEVERKLRDGQTIDAINPLWLKAQTRSNRLDIASKDLVKTLTKYAELSKQDELARWDAHEILERALSFSASSAAETGIMLHRQFQHPAPEVQVVGSWLQQAVLNALLNAIQQLQEKKRKGNVLLATRAGSSDGKYGLQIRICDDGPGIHTALHERVFSLGYTSRKGGSGIGLFISRRLIESMNGKITVEESYPLWGTTILIELPTIDVSYKSASRA